MLGKLKEKVMKEIRESLDPMNKINKKKELWDRVRKQIRESAQKEWGKV